MFTFTKNKRNGNWDIIGPANQLTPGSTVDVTKQNGDISRVIVGNEVATTNSKGSNDGTIPPHRKS